MLTANQLTAVPPLDVVPKLLSLDLSFNSIKSFSGIDVFSTVPLLMNLRLENCDIETVLYAGTSPLAELKALTTLDLSNNKLQDLSELEQLFRCYLPQISDLDLSGNAFADLEEYTSWATRYASAHSALRVLDGKQQCTEIAAASMGDLQLLHVNDPMVQDSASCSCLEGNPCAVKYNCKNWSRRIEIAKAAREKKKLLLGF